ncbi:MAG: hypothetical protein SF051_06765 [Elusimicrobiota bacterium]|nr:hypothetical protein [Elusimicrobiota bacterium]
MKRLLLALPLLTLAATARAGSLGAALAAAGPSIMFTPGLTDGLLSDLPMEEVPAGTMGPLKENQCWAPCADQVEAKSFSNAANLADSMLPPGKAWKDSSCNHPPCATVDSDDVITVTARREDPSDKTVVIPAPGGNFVVTTAGRPPVVVDRNNQPDPEATARLLREQRERAAAEAYANRNYNATGLGGDGGSSRRGGPDGQAVGTDMGVNIAGALGGNSSFGGDSGFGGGSGGGDTLVSGSPALPVYKGEDADFSKSATDGSLRTLNAGARRALKLAEAPLAGGSALAPAGDDAGTTDDAITPAKCGGDLGVCGSVNGN